jgi:hypothetical protein
MGATGAMVIGVLAIRWTRREEALPEVVTVSADDARLNEKLDDELRDLD